MAQEKTDYGKIVITLIGLVGVGVVFWAMMKKPTPEQIAEYNKYK